MDRFLIQHRYLVGAVTLTLVTLITLAFAAPDIRGGVFAVWSMMVGALIAAHILQRRRTPSQTSRTAFNFHTCLEQMVDLYPDPAIIIRAGTLLVETANQQARTLLPAVEAGRHISSIVRAPAMLEALQKVPTTGEVQDVFFTLGGNTNLSYQAILTHLPKSAIAWPDQQQCADCIVIYMRDISDAQRIDKMRTDFVANVSHELRTPITAMLGFIETLRGHARDDEQAREKFLSIMERETSRMLRLVMDLLSLSKIELKENQVPEGIVDLSTVIQDAAITLAPVIENFKAQLTIENHLVDEERYINGDTDEILQVVVNLLDNAIKYSGDNPSVCIILGVGREESFCVRGEAYRIGDTAEQVAARSGRNCADLVYIQVKDHGGGITRSALPRLTERFFRIDEQLSRVRGGTGLGLAIVKHIISRHKGGLQIESTLGQGSAFTCYFCQDTSATNTTKPSTSE